MAVLKFKEPLPEDSNEISKIQLINLLNTYRAESSITLDLLKEYVIQYIDHNFVGDSSILKKNIDKINYSDSFFIIARLVYNGWSLPSECILKLQSFLNSLSIDKEQKVNKVSKVLKEIKNISVKEDMPNKDHLYFIELYLDHKLHNTPETFSYVLETQVTKIKECLEYIENLLIIYKDDIKYKNISSSDFKVISSLLENLKEAYTIALTSSPKRQRPINKAVMSKNVKYSNSKLDNIDKYYTPMQTIGKKKMFVFDTEKKLLFCFFSTAGFTYSGTTLKGYTDKSFCIKVKEKNLLSNSLSSLNTFCSDNEDKKKEVTTGRFNKNMLILVVS